MPQTPTLDDIGMVLAREFGPYVAVAVMTACQIAREERGADFTALEREAEFGARAQRILRAICDGRPYSA